MAEVDNSGFKLVLRARKLNNRIRSTPFADDVVAQIAETSHDSLVCVNGQYVTKAFVENYLTEIEKKLEPPSQRFYSMEGKGKVIGEELR